jgi:predicted dehydrogenase
MTQDLGVALIGSGFMGKAHALAWRAVRPVFGTDIRPRLVVLCDQPAQRAATMADQFGFARATDDWRNAIADPCVGVVSITTPNKLHAEMVIAAAAAGKHVWCEKPLAVSLKEAGAMAKAVRDAGVTAVAGYNYTQNPTFLHACKLVQEGLIGRVIHFRGFVDEDYQADPQTPWTWRSLRAEAGLGVLGDMTCHLISMALRLVGPVESLSADMQTVHRERPLADGSGQARVENEDIASALLHFACGAHGVISSSRVAWGRKNRLSFEVHGDKGMITFDQERMNELQLYVPEGPKSRQGFTTILTGPEHAPYGLFNPAPGHTLGFQDQKTVEAAALLDMIGGKHSTAVFMQEALTIEKIIHAIAAAASTRKPISL